MNRLIVFSLFVLLMASVTQAVPVLQLYIDGATYDDVTETWVSSSNSFDLYVVGQGELNNVKLGMAVQGLNETSNRTGISVDINGNTYDSWTNRNIGRSNSSNTSNTMSSSADMAIRDMAPAMYAEIGLGNFTNSGGINDINSSDWLPTQGYNAGQDGWFQSYHIDISGGYAIHFDAYTLNAYGQVDQFAPLSHSANGGGSQVPEPTTMILFGIGLAGAGLVRKFRKN